MCRKLHVISHLFIALNNDVFLELHPFFLIKDQHTRCTLLHDRCRNGLYPIPSLELPSGKMCLSAIKPSSEQWNVRFGHPSFKVVSRVLHTHNLSFVSNKNEAHVCDACQWAKSHKLPFPKSISVSKVPLELMFSDVRGPAPTSVSKNNYYVSFIDDFSKFALVYLLKHKSDVFQRFQEFQAHVERLFDRKVLAMQTDWSGECQKLSPFFDHVGISHLVSCPHTHQQNGSVECKHRHIVKVGLVLLAHASMPLKFWDEHFSPLCFLTIVFLLLFLLMFLLLKSYLTPSWPIPSSVLLVAPAGPTCNFITPTNMLFAPSNVPFLATTLTIRAICVLTYPLIASIFPVTWCLMRMFFLLPSYMSMLVLDFTQKFPCFLLPSLIPHHLGVGLWTLITCLSLLILLCSNVLHRVLQDQHIPWISPFYLEAVPIFCYRMMQQQLRIRGAQLAPVWSSGLISLGRLHPNPPWIRHLICFC
jgi:hypothetical protein